MKRHWIWITVPLLACPLLGQNSCQETDADGDDWTVEQGDCDDADATVYPGAEEHCDGRDENCDLVVDDNPVDGLIQYADNDMDGYGAGEPVSACEQLTGYVADSTDCNDGDAMANPAGTEVCDGIDQNCDGNADEEATDALVQYMDMDGDGYGSQDFISDCEAKTGYVLVSGDCDDLNSALNPMAVEVCDGVDQDCDGMTDDGATDARVWYQDLDGDKYGSTVTTTSCTQPTGYVAVSGDCNDSSASIYPGTNDCAAVSSRASCADVLKAGESVGNGVYELKLPGGNTRVYCDMTTDGGGWTLLASYQSNLELFNYDHTVHQTQTTSGGGATVATAPALWQSGTFGHVAHDEFAVSGHDVKLECRTSTTGTWFSQTRNDLINGWGVQDYGTVGNSSGWATIGGVNRGRSNHFICGGVVNTSTTGTASYIGIGYCAGAGSSGSWGNHKVSFSFNRSTSQYTGGLSIGCNGSGINNGKDGSWQGRMWIR